MSSISVIIVDDHAVYRAGVTAMLEKRADSITIVGEAADGETAVELVGRLQPDVVLMDVQMPGRGGIEATRRISATHPEVAVLILTMFDDDTLFQALRAGARGYLLKQATIDELIAAVHAVARGEAIFSPGAATRLVTHFGSMQEPALRPFPQLTAREHEILQLIAEGQDPPHIARSLELSTKTVRNYIATILNKLQLRDREQVAAAAREAGLG